MCDQNDERKWEPVFPQDNPSYPPNFPRRVRVIPTQRDIEQSRQMEQPWLFKERRRQGDRDSSSPSTRTSPRSLSSLLYIVLVCNVITFILTAAALVARLMELM